MRSENLSKRGIKAPIPVDRVLHTHGLKSNPRRVAVLIYRARPQVVGGLLGWITVRVREHVGRQTAAVTS